MMTQQTTPAAPKGWALSGGVDGHATLTYNGAPIATAACGTPAQQASLHALLGRLRTARAPHTHESREDSPR